MLNAIQLFGLILILGLAAGEAARRLLGLPRTTGYVLFGLFSGQSGLGWITPGHIESAQLFVDLALGLILFELGYLVPRSDRPTALRRLLAAVAVAALPGLLLCALFVARGHAIGDALFAASLALATSAAITIATCSDVGARGERSGLLYTLVAGNGGLAFAAVALVAPFLADTVDHGWPARLAASLASIAGSLLIGGACAGLVLFAARKLEKQSENQHLLILGSVILGVGTAIRFDISVFLPMLIFGVLVHVLDDGQRVIATRIARDARIFLVVAFVLAGAALDIRLLADYWPAALGVVAVRFAGQALGSLAAAHLLDLPRRDALFLSLGLQPMSSVALVLLVNTQLLYTRMPADLAGTLSAALLLMQLLGPYFTQTAIKGFGEATRLAPAPRP